MTGSKEKEILSRLTEIIKGLADPPRPNQNGPRDGRPQTFDIRNGKPLWQMRIAIPEEQLIKDSVKDGRYEERNQQFSHHQRSYLSVAESSGSCSLEYDRIR
jgi:hypothetical protein